MNPRLLKTSFAAFILIFLTAALYPMGRRLPAETVKVAFLGEETRIHVKSEYGFTVFDLENSASEKFPPWENFVLTPGRRGINIGNEVKMGAEIRIVPSDGREFIRINGRRYRGTVIIINSRQKLTAINEVDIEGYLKGVLPMEISPRWPMDALKAQAIASRTYAVNNMGKYGDLGYDLSSDVFSQVYAGAEVEDSRTNRAVKETEGKIIVYGDSGALARSYFHSSCGGHTADIRKVWGSDIPYLRGVYCPYCLDSPRARWEVEVSPSRIKRQLNGLSDEAGEIKNVEVKSRTGSGRVDKFLISYEGGEVEMTGHQFRMAMGPDMIKSALFTIGRSEEPFHFYGRGWGHGVGMCQWGARGQALQGKDFRQILSYYMPGTEVRRWSY